MGLQTQAPFWVIKTVLDCGSRIGRLFVAIHRLQQKMFEVQGFEEFGSRFNLREDKFELLAADLIERRV